VKERTLLFVVLVTALLVAAGLWVAQNVNLMPAEPRPAPPSSTSSSRAMLGLAAVIFLLVEGLLLLFGLPLPPASRDEGDAVRFTATAPRDRVTLIPALIVVVIGFYSFRVLAASEIVRRISWWSMCARVSSPGPSSTRERT